MAKKTRLTTHVFAAALAFFAFSISLIIGLVVDNPFTTVILRGVGAMVLFYLIGLILGGIGAKAIMENFQEAMDEMELTAGAAEDGSDNSDDAPEEAGVVEVGERTEESAPAEPLAAAT